MGAIPKDHFEGSGNLTKGQRKKGNAILSELLPFELESAASAGGAASEAMSFPGLKAGDVVMGITQKTAGATGNAIVAYGTPADGTLSVTWDADPGAGAVLTLLVRRP